MTTCKCGGHIITVFNRETSDGKITVRICDECGNGVREVIPYQPLDYIYVTVKLGEEESE